MQRKTVTALIVFLLLLLAVWWMMKRPEKGQRTSERPRPIQPIAKGAVQKVTLTSKGATVVITRDKEGWKLTRPVDYPADTYSADAMVEKLEKLEFGDLVTEQKSRHPEYEVDDSKGVRVVAEGGGGKTLADFYLGKVVDDFTMLRPAGQDQVYQAVGSLRFLFDREVKNWRRRTIIDFKQEELRRLEVQRGEAKVVLSRAEDKKPWKVESATTPIEKLDESTVSSLVSTFASLSAFDFADGVSPAKAGLDRPTFRLTAGLKNGSTVTLLVGGSQGDDYWVQKQGTPQIFVVKKYGLENLLKRPIDFRDKTIWSFKTEDVVGLTLDKKKDKELARLTLKGSEWMIDGKKAKDADRIKGALEALAALKAEGFASQSAKELGLDKPGWVIEVQLKDKSKRQLTVGSVEKDSIFGVSRKGSPDIYTLRKWALDRFLLEPKSFKP